MTSLGKVFIVEDNLDDSESLKFLFETAGFSVSNFHTVESFLLSKSHLQTGCLIVDVRMPGMSGLELLEYLKQQGILLPVILITAYADVPMVVRGMNAGAKDFLLKPYAPKELLEATKACFKEADDIALLQDIQQQVNLLSEKEHKIIQLILNGHLNKQIADKLHMSISTIEVHRSAIMKKLRATNVTQLIKHYLLATQAQEFHTIV